MNSQELIDLREGTNDWLNIQEVIRSSFEKLNQCISEQDTAIYRLSDHVDKLNAEVAQKTNEKRELEERVAITRDRQSALEKSLLMLESAVESTIERSQTDIDGLVAVLSRRLSGAGRPLPADHGPAVAALTERVRAVERAADGLRVRENSALLAQRMGDIEGTLGTVSSMLQSRTGRVDAATIDAALLRKVDVTTVEAQMDLLRTQLNAKAGATDVSAGLGRLGRAVEKVAEELEDAKRAIDRNEASAHRRQAMMDKMHDVVETAKAIRTR